MVLRVSLTESNIEDTTMLLKFKSEGVIYFNLTYSITVHNMFTTDLLLHSVAPKYCSSLFSIRSLCSLKDATVTSLSKCLSKSVNGTKLLSVLLFIKLQLLDNKIN